MLRFVGLSYACSHGVGEVKYELRAFSSPKLNILSKSRYNVDLIYVVSALA